MRYRFSGLTMTIGIAYVVDHIVRHRMVNDIKEPNFRAGFVKLIRAAGTGQFAPAQRANVDHWNVRIACCHLYLALVNFASGPDEETSCASSNGSHCN
jgi:hypothetical protein